VRTQTSCDACADVCGVSGSFFQLKVPCARCSLQCVRSTLTMMQVCSAPMPNRTACAPSSSWQLTSSGYESSKAARSVWSPRCAARSTASLEPSNALAIVRWICSEIVLNKICKKSLHLYICDSLQLFRVWLWGMMALRASLGRWSAAVAPLASTSLARPCRFLTAAAAPAKLEYKVRTCSTHRTDEHTHCEAKIH
jgi:hypothetical protein